MLSIIEEPVMPFELRQLRYAVAAADYGSFHQAAEALRLKQSTLSRSIHQMEQRLGVVLFIRFHTGVKATPVGTEFLRGARRLIEYSEWLTAMASAVARGDGGRLAIGFSTSLSAGNLRATIVEFSKRFPDVKIDVIEDSRIRLRSALRARHVDIAIVTGEAHGWNCRAMALWSERVIVALPEAHRLAGQDIVYWTDLKGEKLLLSRQQAGPEIMDILISKLASPDDRPNLIQHDISRGDVLSLVAANFGISLMCEAATGLNCAGVIYREARDGSGAARVGYTAYWEEVNENPTLKNFIKLLEERYPPLPNGAGETGF